MKVTITEWHGAAYWRWNTDEDDDICGICRHSFEAACPDCQLPGDNCPPLWGECSHVYHMHCIHKWISQEASKGQCPLDRQPWEDKRA
ncbi:hypothetical protein CXG81DRAFT_23150 [Caulochytrium protostelioides]|uniref:Anaphase-promoting complex subunit 11 n=1 Tax=Caulochytrium protostelioides TaxID=1555241 RepID=A0A4P9XF46_9FUNG|nr:hypothetical protein CXG81DRAFT_23150 [Caulochytrium protostelioides]|eukprot:RKP04197.1 hypothetical protein CXG81DRAFT_23150 [Caulochytrium protostelioides]